MPYSIIAPELCKVCETCRVKINNIATAEWVLWPFVLAVKVRRHNPGYGMPENCKPLASVSPAIPPEAFSVSPHRHHVVFLDKVASGTGTPCPLSVGVGRCFDVVLKGPRVYHSFYSCPAWFLHVMVNPTRFCRCVSLGTTLKYIQTVGHFAHHEACKQFEKTSQCRPEIRSAHCALGKSLEMSALHVPGQREKGTRLVRKTCTCRSFFVEHRDDIGCCAIFSVIPFDS